jgi:putative flippase GtrA
MSTTLNLKQRLIYFIIIGAAAASVHLMTVLNLVACLQWQPLTANILAFLVAFNVSFLGHKYLTFARLHQEKQLRLPHFFLIAASAGIMNELCYYALLRYTQLNYMLALILVLVGVSIYSFVCSRFWACR